MVWILNELLDIDARVAESLFGLCSSSMEALYKGDVVMSDAHATTATSGYGLDHNRVADPFGHTQCILLIVHDAFSTGCCWATGFFCQSSAHGFILPRVHRPRVRSNKTDIAPFANVCKMGVHGQEAVSRVDGINVG